MISSMQPPNNPGAQYPTWRYHWTSRPDRNRAQHVFRGQGGKGRKAGPAAGRPISPQAQEIARDSSKKQDGIGTVAGLRAPPAPALPVLNLSEVDRLSAGVPRARLPFGTADWGRTAPQGRRCWVWEACRRCGGGPRGTASLLHRVACWGAQGPGGGGSGWCGREGGFLDSAYDNVGYRLHLWYDFLHGLPHRPRPHPTYLRPGPHPAIARLRLPQSPGPQRRQLPPSPPALAPPRQPPGFAPLNALAPTGLRPPHPRRSYDESLTQFFAWYAE